MRATKKRVDSEKDNLEEAKALLASAKARIALLEDGDLQEAIKNYEQALGIYKGLDDQKGVAATLFSLGDILDMLGEYDDALRHLEEALTI